jgi:GNAT superfamily N-acetyltransferase
MSMNPPTYRLLNRSELDEILSWAAAEGWNPGRADADAFWAADPEGYWGMFLDGGLIGSASTVSYGGKLGFVGLFIVRPEWRGQGLGGAFWNFFIQRLEERLAPNAPMALDGVFARQPYYARSGFVFSHRNLRMEGTGVATPTWDRHVIELSRLREDEVRAFDAVHFGCSRSAFLKRWLQPQGGLAVGWLDDRIRGYGVIRPCETGYKIGPLFAETPRIAESLYLALSSHAAGEPVFLDIPENNPGALALAERHQLREVFGCARMWRGPALELPWRQIYGVTTFELG